MGVNQQQLIGPFSSLVTGTDASIKVPSTGKYHTLGIRMNVTAVASITHAGANKWSSYISSVQVRVDGSVEIDITPAIHEALDRAYVWGDPTNVLIIPLSWPNMRLGGGEDISGYGTADVGTMDVIVKLASGAHVISLLELYAMRSAINEPLGQHLSIRRHPRSVSGAGELEINDIFQVGETIYAFALDDNTFDKAVFKEGNTIIHEAVQETSLAFGELIGRADTGYVIDMLGRDRHDEAHLVTPRDHRLTTTWAGAATPDIAVVSLSPRMG